MAVAKPTLWGLVKEGDIDAVTSHLEDNKDSLDAQEKETWDTPLHKAAQFGHVAIAKVLLEAKANPNVENMKGKTCLHVACDVYRDDTTGDFCWEDMVELLVNEGAVALKDDDGKLPDPGEDAVTRVESAIEKATKQGKDIRKEHEANRQARNKAKMDKMFEDKLVEHLNTASAATVAVRESPSRPDGWG